MHREKVRSSWTLSGGAVLLLAITASGCHDGPLYGIKAANPYYSIKQWKDDEKLATTDHTRRAELARLVDLMPQLPEERQAFWHEHLRTLMDNDINPEMRRLAVMASAHSRYPDAAELIHDGLNDESLKVRLAACEALGKRSGEAAARKLAELAGSTADLDVRNAALAALGNHRSQIAIDTLRLQLESRNPATRQLAVASLRGATGKNYGDDPQVWIAALDGEDIPEQPVQLAERLKGLLR